MKFTDPHIQNSKDKESWFQVYKLKMLQSYKRNSSLVLCFLKTPSVRRRMTKLQTQMFRNKNDRRTISCTHLDPHAPELQMMPDVWGTDKVEKVAWEASGFVSLDGRHTYNSLLVLLRPGFDTESRMLQKLNPLEAEHWFISLQRQPTVKRSLADGLTVQETGNQL